MMEPQHVYHHSQKPAKMAHGILYWLLVGWFWSPLRWACRVLLWVFAMPLGIWRSYANSKKNDRRRMNRADF